jgi:hypothetical protein
MKAGYIPQMGCNQQAALEYVSWSEGYPAEFKEERIWIIVEGLKLPTPYYWENDLLLKVS